LDLAAASVSRSALATRSAIIEGQVLAPRHYVLGLIYAPTNTPCWRTQRAAMALSTSSANSGRHTTKSGNHGSGALYTMGEPSMRLT